MKCISHIVLIAIIAGCSITIHNLNSTIDIQKETINELKSNYDEEIERNEQLLSDNEQLTIKINQMVDEQ